MSISVVVPCWNSPDVLGLCLHALKLWSPTAEVLVMDRSDQEESRCKNHALSYGVRWFDMRQPPPNKREMYSVTNNEGIRAASHEWVALVSDDIIVTPRWDETLLADARLMEQRGVKVGMLGARCNRIYGPQMVGVLPPNVVQPWWRIFTPCAFARRDTLLEVGGFTDEWEGTGQDDDLALRLAKAGYVNAVSRCEVFHVGGFARTRAGVDINEASRKGIACLARDHGPDWLEQGNKIQDQWFREATP